MAKKLINKYKKMSIVAKAAFWFTIASVLQKGVAFFTVPIFTRIMSPEQYGVFSVYLSWISVFTVLGGMDFHTCSYINGLAKMDKEKDKKELAVSLLNLSFLITFGWMIIYLILKKYINNYLNINTTMTILMFLEVFFLPAVNLWTTKQRYTYNYKKLLAWTFCQVILNAVLGIILVISVNEQNQAMARVLSISIVQIIFGIILIIGFIYNAKRIIVTKYWKHSLQLHIPLLPHKLSLTVLSSADRIMISNMTGTIDAAIYSVAYSASMAINLIKLSINDALTPWVYNCIKEKKYDELRSKTIYVILLVLVMIFVFVLFAPEIMIIMGSKTYAQAVYVMPPVAASVYFTFLYNLFSNIEFYYEKTKEIMFASIITAILNIILNLVFIKIFGYIAAAYTTLLCYMVLSLMHYLVMKRIVKTKLGNVELFNVKVIMLLSIIVLLSVIIFSVLYNYMLLRYIVILAIFIILVFKRKKIIELLKSIKIKN